MEGLCRKANQKLHASARKSRYMSKNETKILISFITSEFQLLPLVFVASRQKIQVHEKALQITHEDGACSFEILQRKYNSLTIDERNIR